MNEVEEKLRLRFEAKLPEYKKRRIIFWYDESQTFSDELEQYQLDDIHILHVNDHNLIATKYQIEHVYPEASFLLYFNSGRPHDLDNPLLDIYLYSEEFKIDAMANLMDEIGLTDSESEFFFKAQAGFFQNKTRQKEFRDLVIEAGNLTIDKLSLATFCVLAHVKELSFSALCEKLFYEQASGIDTSWQQINKFADVKVFWRQAELKYHYEKPEPTIEDLLISIFVTKLSAEFEDKIPAQWQGRVLGIKNNSVVFLNRWMNQVNSRDSYITVADHVAQELEITKFFKRKDIAFVALSDTFSEGDKYITNRIAENLLEAVISFDQLEQIILSRRNTFWQSRFKLYYKGLLAAVRLLKGIAHWEQQEIDADSVFMWTTYQTYYFQIDQEYRHFYLAYDQWENPADTFHYLQDKIENFYKTGFLNEFASKWSEATEKLQSWSQLPAVGQEEFYETYIAPFVTEQRRVIVIVSDALRYEAAEELAQELGDSHYYQVETEVMRGVIPGYTALGMASLLPHEQITYQGSQVMVDGQSSQGIKNRAQILKNKFGSDKANAYRAQEVLEATRSEIREMFTGGQVYYIYHDTIDATGDHAASEDQVFKAIEEAKRDIRKMADRFINDISAKHFFITADHGFIYTRDSLIKADKISVNSEDAVANNRRFYLNTDASEQDGMHTLAVDNVAESELFVHIPKGTMRLAISGAGDKFVHGGILPQETMIPVLKIRGESGRDTRVKSAVQLITEMNRITNVVTYLTFLQLQKVTPDVLPRTVRAYFVDAGEKLISNEITLTADSTSDSPQERVIKEKFIFANKAYNSLGEYYFMMVDDATGEILDRRQFTIDLYYED